MLVEEPLGCGWLTRDLTMASGKAALFDQTSDDRV
jgi:hypothetical protein